MMTRMTDHSSTIKTAAVVLVGGCTVLAATATTTVVLLLRSLSNSVGVSEPTETQIKEENPETECALFRYFPKLSKTLAWRSLGAIDKTPVHVCSYPQGIQFFVKREDLINTNEYGGNKVRTLQHTLGVLEARRDKKGDKACKQLVSIGSGGSNQVVATVVHARKLGWNNKKQRNNDDDDDAVDANAVNACWFDKDEPDLDNTLNYLSVLSFPNVSWTHDWGGSRNVFQIFRAIGGVFTQRDYIPMMMGGNCSVGVLGQAGGIIELAEQIEAGECPDDIERIYLPVGSACTVSGLILGTVLVRHCCLGGFFKKTAILNHPRFKIVACNVHETIAKMDRLFGIHTNSFLGSFFPLTIVHSVVGACRVLKKLGGPDLESECRSFVKTSVEIRADADVVGLYGGHSELSRKAANYYDESGIVTDYQTGRSEKELWVCGHFVAKALQPLIADLEEEAAAVSSQEGQSEPPPKYMLWQTKSAIQPRGPVNEWEQMLQQNQKVKRWATDGKAESKKYRPGKVSVLENDNNNIGNPDDYRSLMTSVD